MNIASFTYKVYFQKMMLLVKAQIYSVRLKSKSGRKCPKMIWQIDAWESGINVKSVRNSEKWCFFEILRSKSLKFEIQKYLTPEKYFGPWVIICLNFKS